MGTHPVGAANAHLKGRSYGACLVRVTLSRCGRLGRRRREGRVWAGILSIVGKRR